MKKTMSMMRITRQRLLDVACVFGLVALGLMVWSVVSPHPIPVILAMSVGQVVGTISFGAFVVIVIGDYRLELVRRAHKKKRHDARA